MPLDPPLRLALHWLPRAQVFNDAARRLLQDLWSSNELRCPEAEGAWGAAADMSGGSVASVRPAPLADTPIHSAAAAFSTPDDPAAASATAGPWQPDGPAASLAAADAADAARPAAAGNASRHPAPAALAAAGGDEADDGSALSGSASSAFLRLRGLLSGMLPSFGCRML